MRLQWRALTVVCVCCVFATLGAAETVSSVYVAPDGSDANAGGRGSPVATLGKAIALAEASEELCEIVVRGGVYRLSRTVSIPRSDKKRRLVIRAAENETPIFDGSREFPDVEPMEGFEGVFTVKGEFPSDAPPKIWEERSLRHFVNLAGPEAVAVLDYSSCVLDENTLAIRYAGGSRPGPGDLLMGGAHVGIQVERDDVTLRGLHFRNFASGGESTGLRVGRTGLITAHKPGKEREALYFTRNTIVENCVARHSYYGFNVYLTGSNTVFRKCEAYENVCGIYISGLDTVVEYSRFVNEPNFHERLNWDYKFSRCGIRFYGWPEGAVVRHNFISGFNWCGLHSKGSPGRFVVENNTIVGIPYSFSIDKGFIVRYNIFADNQIPLRSDLKGELEALIDYNLFWGPKDLSRVIVDESLGGKPHNIFADPLFASPETGDYRLLPGSPAIGIADGVTAGAFPQVPAGYAPPAAGRGAVAESAREQAPRIYYVAETGRDMPSGGARSLPFATLQYALERVLPGDRVRIFPGTYFGSYALDRRNTEHGRPIVVEGLFPNTVFLDGLRQEKTLFRVSRTPNVLLRNLNFRWYVDAALDISDSPGVRVSACRFFNRFWTGDTGPTCRSLTITRCAGFVVDHCIFTRTRYGLSVYDSPNGLVEHNTATGNAVTHMLWRGPESANITIRYNSFNWNGNQLLNFNLPRETVRDVATIDYNNYGTTFKQPEGTLVAAGRFGRSLEKPFSYLPSNREFMSREVGPKSDKFVNMEDWLEYSRQDKHSIYADPKWVDPRAGRFDVAKDSPNILEDGRVIGALGYLGENPNALPEVVLASPYEGAELAGRIVFEAEASDLDGEIAKLEFYAGERLLGEVDAPPYIIEASGLERGELEVYVKAFDDKNGCSVSDKVKVLVR